MEATVLQDVGQYTMVRKNQCVEHFGVTYRIIVYGAYNAFGLIGSECNGVAVLNETIKGVVLDEECKEGTGYFGASERQVKRFKEIVK